VAANQFFEELPERVDPERIMDVDHAYLFEITGEGTWLVEVRRGTLSVTEGADGDADATITTSSEVFERLIAGKQNAMTAYMTGKLKVSGDMSAALKLQSLF
jgi:putative sterol carrier protein